MFYKRCFIITILEGRQGCYFLFIGKKKKTQKMEGQKVCPLHMVMELVDGIAWPLTQYDFRIYALNYSAAKWPF